MALQVGDSSDSSCFDPTKNVSPDFVFSIEPPNQVVQCQPMRIWWDPAQVRGYVGIPHLGVGGISGVVLIILFCCVLFFVCGWIVDLHCW